MPSITVRSSGAGRLPVGIVSGKRIALTGVLSFFTTGGGRCTPYVGQRRLRRMRARIPARKIISAVKAP
jgi:hypothetical protein